MAPRQQLPWLLEPAPASSCYTFSGGCSRPQVSAPWKSACPHHPQNQFLATLLPESVT